jgi:hypothetical protein
MLEIPTDYLTHFVRGYFDGDGSISLYERGKSIRAQVLGSESLCRSLKELFGREYGVEVGSVNKNRPEGRIYRLGYSGNTSASAFLSWLYRYSEPHNRLDRKYNKYQEWVSGKR